MKLSKFLGFLSILCGVAILVGPWTFASVCTGTDATQHACHTTRLYAMAAGGIILVLGLLLMMIKIYILDKFLSLLLFVAGIGTILVPTYLAPVCNAKDMHCRTLMLPFLIGMGALVAFLGILFLLKGVKRPKPEVASPPSETAPELPSEQFEATAEKANTSEASSEANEDGAVKEE